MLSILLIILILLSFYQVDHFTILKATYPTGQLACSKKDLLINLIKSSTEMALKGSRLYCSPHQNLFSINHIKNELTRNPSSTDGSHSGNTFPIPSHKLILGSALVPAPVSALPFSDELFKQFMKAYFGLNQGLKQPLAERKQPLKAKILEVYYGKLHMDYH